MKSTYNSVTFGLPLFEVDSPRARNMPDELDDIIIQKMMAIDIAGFNKAYDSKDGNYLCGLAAKALTALKVREKTNNNDGYMVEMIQKVGGGIKGWPWCMYEVMACIGIAETLTGIKSKVITSGSCYEVIEACDGTGLEIKFDDSTFGCIWVKIYPGTTNGHTGIFERWKYKGTVGILNEGNTTEGTEADRVIREGGGSYQVARSLDHTWKICIRPFPIVENLPPVEIPPAADKDEVPEYWEHSDRVATIQRALNSLGEKLKVDGKYGPLTKGAISRFQFIHNLPDTGILDKETLDLILGE